MTLKIDDAATVWLDPRENPSAESPLLILMHGYGSNEQDLAGLAPGLPGVLRIASLRAPLPMPEYGYGAYKWFPLTIREHPHFSAAFDREAQANIDMGAENAASAVLAWLDAVLADGLAPEQILIGGFSQGGACAVQSFRHAPERFAGVLNFSGFVAPGAHPNDAAIAETKPRVFYGYGLADTVIPDVAVDFTRSWLTKNTDATVYAEPGMGHSISAYELQLASEFIHSIL